MLNISTYFCVLVKIVYKHDIVLPYSPPNAIFQIAVGRMNYDRKKLRGVQDRSFVPVKLVFHKEASLKDVLATCKDATWPSHDPPTAKYHLPDGSGAKISSRSKLDIGLRGGERTQQPWTISNYLKVSGTYPSRMRVYCVRDICDGNESMGILTVMLH